MSFEVRRIEGPEIAGLRARRVEEMSGQVVHHSIHQRDGWTVTHGLEFEGRWVGFGSIAIAGPWTGRPTVFEFYLDPVHRCRAFEAFEAYLEASGVRHFEVQTSDGLLTVMLHAYASNVVSEKIVFADHQVTALAMEGTSLRQVTPIEEVREAMRRRRGGGEWVLEWKGQPVGKGGILFHYNEPYGDVHMEIDEAFRRRGLGAFLVQELKRCCRELGAVPAARCNVGNTASRQTLQRAGFAPRGHMLLGDITR
jgi:GNAT superfamily N-acetyltransferase